MHPGGLSKRYYQLSLQLQGSYAFCTLVEVHRYYDNFHPPFIPLSLWTTLLDYSLSFFFFFFEFTLRSYGFRPTLCLFASFSLWLQVALGFNQSFAIASCTLPILGCFLYPKQGSVKLQENVLGSWWQTNVPRTSFSFLHRSFWESFMYKFPFIFLILKVSIT